jgi:tetratricopeptide (TPR) repeat protein
MESSTAAVRAALAKKDLAAAERWLSELAGSGSDDAERQLQLGLIAFHRFRYDEAIEYLRRAVDLDADSAEGWHELGRALAKRGMIDEWVECDGSSPSPEVVARRRTPVLDEALRAFRRVVALEPRHVDAHLQIGRIQSDKGHFDAAASAYRRVLDLDRQNCVAHEALGTMLLMSGGSPAEAVGRLREAVRLNPYSGSGHYNLGIGLTRLGRPAAAAESFERAVLLEPGNASFNCNLGLAQLRSGSIARGLAALADGLRHGGIIVKLMRNYASVAGHFGWPDVAQSLARAAAAIESLPGGGEPSKSVPVAREQRLRAS